jgi:transglutaminase-like putative cysteine protease
MAGFLNKLDITFWLQAALLVTAATSVQAAGWVESPPFALVVFLAALMATLLVNLRERRKAHHLWAVVAGGLFAYAGGVFVTKADQWYLNFGELNSSLAHWWAAVMNGDTTADTLPLSVTIVAITWMMAYFTSWCLFRYRNVWATLLIIGTATVLNLTYLPESFFGYLFVFLFICLLLLVHVTSLSRLTILQASGVSHPGFLHRQSLAHGLLLSVIIIAITVVLPIGDPPVAPLNWFYNPVNGAVVDDLKGELRRVFVAPNSKPYSIRALGSVLSLVVRPVITSEEPVLFAEADYPLYWSAVAYDQYTSKVWRVQNTESRPVVSEIRGEQVGPSVAESIDYVVYMYVESPYLMMAGNPVDVHPNAQQDIPASRVFRLDLTDPEQNMDLPTDMQRLASTLAASEGSLDPAQMPGGLLVSTVTKELSPSGDRATLEVETNSPSYYSDLRQAIDSPGATVGLEVMRTPLMGSPVRFRALGQLGLGNSYSVTSEFIVAGEETLRNASRDYPLGILERYLQIPKSLPERVSALTSDIVAGASNPYDTAVAIETYLRTLKYNEIPTSLPYEADAVDYFLFESRESYSDYFASAMAMMLRTRGIPTRLVLGFGPGEADPGGQGFLVRDRDNHSWPEVYFPDMGWIPFEPTPIYDVRRGLDFLKQDQQAVTDDTGATLSGGEATQDSFVRYFGTPLGMGGALFVLFLLAGVVLMRILWIRQYGSPGSPQTAYERMHRLATLLGFPSPSSQTAFEFSHNLSELIPEVGPDVELVSNIFVRQRYGGVTPTSMEEVHLVRAWSRIKGAFITHLRQTTRESAVPPG